MGMLANRRAIEVEDVRNGAARQSNEGKQCAGPLVVEPVVHLYREQHAACTPHGPQKGLCRKGRRGLVLVCVDYKRVSFGAS